MLGAHYPEQRGSTAGAAAVTHFDNGLCVVTGNTVDGGLVAGLLERQVLAMRPYGVSDDGAAAALARKITASGSARQAARIRR